MAYARTACSLLIMRIECVDRVLDLVRIVSEHGNHIVGHAGDALAVRGDAVGIGLVDLLHFGSRDLGIVVVVAEYVHPGDLSLLHRSGEDLHILDEFIVGLELSAVNVISAEDDEIGLRRLDHSIKTRECAGIVFELVLNVRDHKDAECAVLTETERVLGGRNHFSVPF